MKVLVSDTLSEVGVKIFEETPGIEVDVKTGLAPEELKEIIGEYDGLAIRSATKVTADIIEAAVNLKVIGRAGIGLDNVDIHVVKTYPCSADYLEIDCRFYYVGCYLCRTSNGETIIFPYYFL